MCNLLDAAEVERFLCGFADGVRVVFCAVINRLNDNSYHALVRNIQMAHNFAAAATRGKLGGVIFLSSVDVYGRTPELPITERTVTAPANFYGIAKLTSELLLRRPGALNCPLTVLRLPGVYGPGDGGRSVVGRFLTRLRVEGRVRSGEAGRVLVIMD